MKAQGARVTALDTDARQCALARDAGVVDVVAKNLKGFNGCDVLVLCAPPSVVCDTLPLLAGLDIGLVTDVCSVKGPVMDAAQGLRNFIGGHPMAGSEQTGFAASSARLFENAPYALCVASGRDLPQERVVVFETLLEKMGAKVVRMTVGEHDAAVASVSHVPHAAAFALARAALAQPGALRLAGRGFADTTRVAGSSPKLWADIFLRSPHMLSALSQHIAGLAELADALARRDAVAVEKFLEEGRLGKKIDQAKITRLTRFENKKNNNQSCQSCNLGLKNSRFMA